jgi:hypothetical protein
MNISKSNKYSLKLYRYLVLVVFFFLYFNLTAQTVSLIDSQPMTANGIETTLFTFSIDSQNIPTRLVNVNSYQQENSRGAVLLTTGGVGTTYYSQYGEEAINTIITLYNEGFEIYEFKWLGERGWATNARGFGYHIAVGAYSEMVNHLSDNYIDNPDSVFANGNSGGAIQIAYGLAIYGLESIFDMVVLTGGPPVSDLKTGIFGDGTEPEYWPDGLAGFELTDFMMAWDGNGDYCVNREAPEYIQAQLDTVSLVTDIHPRIYNYSTHINFVQSNDCTNADHQAEIYFDEISSDKDWFFLPNTTEHAVPGTVEGAQLIRELIMNYPNASNVTNNLTTLKTNLSCFPNPFNPSTIIEFSIQNDSKITLTIYNIKGQKVKSIINNELNKGKYSVVWNGDDDNNNPVSSGLYFYKLNVDGKTEAVKKCLLLK